MLSKGGEIPILQVLQNRALIKFSILSDKNTVIISQSDGKGGSVLGSSYKYKTQGVKKILGVNTDIDIKIQTAL